MNKIKECPKCGGEMEEGKIMAATIGGEMIWIKTGKKTKLNAPKVKGFACFNCGFLENFVERK